MLKTNRGYSKMKLASITTSFKAGFRGNKKSEMKFKSQSFYTKYPKQASQMDKRSSVQLMGNSHNFCTTLSPTAVFVDYKDQLESDKNQKRALLQAHLHHHHHSEVFEEEANQERLVFKNGECNVNRANIKKRRQRYMADIFTTLVDIKWRWNLLNFVLAFMLSWLIFALLWWLIAFSHGDFGDKVPKQKPCVEEVQDFSTALLFSIETQQTIGYGSRHTNPHCAEAILVMMFQSCFGVIIQV